MFSRRLPGPLPDAGSCAEQIALWRFIDRITFETKLGDLGMVLSMSGIDPDCRPDEVLHAFSRRYESAMRVFDDRFRVYSYIIALRRHGASARSISDSGGDCGRSSPPASADQPRRFLV